MAWVEQSCCLCAEQQFRLGVQVVVDSLKLVEFPFWNYIYWTATEGSSTVSWVKSFSVLLLSQSGLMDSALKIKSLLGWASS
jgi:hypothetical protein